MVRRGLNRLKRALGVGLLGIVGVAICSWEAIAQNMITPDDTLGEESSIVVPFNSETEFILNGAKRGKNVFHSFEDFNVGNLRGAYFAIPAGSNIEHIFARVTGENPSSISGVLGTLQIFENELFSTDADLYLINPQGVIFNENATLALGGSFTALSSESILFESGEAFSATSPAVPSPQLSVNPSAYLFDSQSTGSIISRSTRININNPNSRGLLVSDGKSINLIGQDILIDGMGLNGGLSAPGGDINIIAVSGDGSLKIDSEDLYSFSDGLGGSDVDFQNALLNVAERGEGNIRIQGNNVNLDESALVTGIRKLDENLTQPRMNAAIAGDIVIRADNSIDIDGGEIINFVFDSGSGGDISLSSDAVVIKNEALISSSTLGSADSGNVSIQADSIVVEDGAWLSTSTFSAGNSGSMRIAAEEIIFRGRGESGRISEAYSDVGVNATGRGGNINILSESIHLQDEASISTESAGKGKSGSITINTKFLRVEGGSLVSSSTVGEGDSGSIEIYSRESTFTGRSENGQIPSSALSFAGNIDKEKKSGESGGIQIVTDSLLLDDGASFSTSISGDRDASSILIKAGRITLRKSGIFSRVEEDSEGNGGNIKLITEALSIEDGSAVSVSTSGKGNSGNIILDAGNITLLNDNDSNSPLRNVISSESEFGAEGNGGSISIDTETLNVYTNGQLTTGALGNGDAGSIIINAIELVVENGDIIAASLNTSGGNIAVISEQIQLKGDSTIATATLEGEEDAGNILLRATAFIIGFDDSDIFASARNGRGGNIELKTPGFFGENFTVASLEAEPDTLENNNRVDINATGDVNGIVTVPDVSFLENSLTSLPNTLVAPERLIANSCIARAADGQSTLVVTGNDGLAVVPDSLSALPFSTSTVQAIPSHSSQPYSRSIEEPTRLYQMADGRIVMSQDCL